MKVTAVPNIKEHWVEEDRVNIDGTIAVTIIYAGESDAGQTYYGARRFLMRFPSVTL